MQTFIADRMDGRIISVLLDDSQKPLEVHMDDPQEEVQTGDILIGRVMQVAWNIRAAFIDIGCGRNCYLPLDDRIMPVYTRKGSSVHMQQGDELIVQVERPAMKTKAPALNAALTLRGRYLLLGTKPYEVGVSRKISEPRRTQLHALAEELVGGPSEEKMHENRNILMRTNAAQADDRVIRQEYELLSDRLQDIITRGMHLTVGSKLFDAGAPWLQHLVDLSESSTGQILIEDEELCMEADRFLQLYHPELHDKLLHYSDPLWPIASKFGLEKILKDAGKRHVWLKSGAYLVIEPTEALTSIDVNSGKIGPGKYKHHREETFLKVNLEAAGEIARQLRLRSISGIIIVDFINLEEEEHRKELMDYFAGRLAADPVPARVVDMTRLGLVEVTRKKTRKSIAVEI